MPRFGKDKVPGVREADAVVGSVGADAVLGQQQLVRVVRAGEAHQREFH